MPTLTRHAVGAPTATASLLVVHILLCAACRPQASPSSVDAAASGPSSHSSDPVGPETLGAASRPSLAAKAPDTPAEDEQRSSDLPASHGESPSARGDKSKHRNRLAHETSPYLLMHAHNPVDWYPWGQEALEKAQRENKVIFLSIGYSSCHWCHVMERESFMDEEIADFLNQHFVCIKLDREERPDVDAIYMKAVQLITRSGGWPLSVFLMPDAKPFFGGTYFPARDGDRPGHTGFLTVIKRIHAVWNDQRQELEESANRLTDFLATELRGQPAATPIALDNELLQRVLDALAEQYDEEYGGFGYDPNDPHRPKFPEPSNLLFLVNRVEQQDDPEARRMLIGTLGRMAMGGIQDHIGGGFHRYSVDRYWHIPHFEKMLYDNGQLATAYAEAYLLTGAEEFRPVLSEMVDFVLREFLAPEGAFYSALDADSEGEEGKFYRWEKEELTSILSPSELAQIALVYGLDGPPNFEDRYYVPLLRQPLGQIAATKQLSEQALVESLVPLRQKLLAARNTRPRPLTDWKILTGWNGLMIRGLADTGRALKEPRYVDAATRAADFLLEELQTEEGRLLRTYSRGQAKLDAYIDDYAFLVDGLVALHRATGDDRWLRSAEELTRKQIELFWDERDGGFFFTSVDHESLIVRGKVVIDGARPAGNSVAASNLLYLARTLPKPEYVSYAERTIQAASGWLEQSPAAAPRLIIAVAELLAQRTDAPTNDG